MKQLTLMSIALMMTCAAAFAASADFPINKKSWENFSQNLNVMNLCDLRDTDLTEIMQGDHPEIAIEFSDRTPLTINFFLKGDLVNLVGSEGNFLEIKQTFYARYVSQELILSTNLTDWKPFLEFITGNASVSLSIQDGKPSINIGAEINQRS